MGGQCDCHGLAAAPQGQEDEDESERETSRGEVRFLPACTGVQEDVEQGQSRETCGGSPALSW